jgi:integrase
VRQQMKSATKKIDPAVLELLSQAQALIDQQRRACRKKKPSASKRAPVSLTDEELLRLLELARGRRTRDWVLMLVTYRHGLRASEALSIRRRDLEGGRLRIQRGKGSEFVDQPLCGHENPLLDEIAAVGTWLAEMGEHGVKGAAKAGGRRSRLKTLQSSQNVKFRPEVDDDRLFPFTRQRFFQLFREYAIEAGLPARKRSPHKLKHSLAKHLLRSNVPVNEVQDWLGWKSLRTADHYTRPDADEVAQSVDRALRSRPAFRQMRQSGLFDS